MRSEKFKQAVRMLNAMEYTLKKQKIVPKRIKDRLGKMWIEVHNIDKTPQEIIQFKEVMRGLRNDI